MIPEELVKRITLALERIANAQEAQVMIFQTLCQDDTPRPGEAKAVMTQTGLVEFR